MEGHNPFLMQVRERSLGTVGRGATRVLAGSGVDSAGHAEDSGSAPVAAVHL